MAAPLSPTPSAVLNFSTPPSVTSRYDVYARSHTTTHALPDNAENDEGDSSPFMSQVRDDIPSPRGPSPPKALRPASRVISGSELSPLKILQQQPQPLHQSQQQQQSPPPPEPQQQPQTRQSIPDTEDGDMLSPAKSMPPPPLPLLSPRKMSAPIKRFPVKVSPPPVVHETPPPGDERKISLHEALRENNGLKRAIEIFEDESSLLDTEPVGANEADPAANAYADDTILTGGRGEQQFDSQHHDDSAYDDEPGGIDDTMMSTFSTFSAVPNMTMLTQMRNMSPAKLAMLAATNTPRAAIGETPVSSVRTPRTSGPLPDRSAGAPPPPYEAGNTTNLMDFTEQFRYGGFPPQISPSRREGRFPSSKTTPHVAATPQRTNTNSFNLLDFDIPPMPTPRSLPTITPRELESLKSGFLSEISSLKASLSGKEAEVNSLKTAVGDAEKRVGECLEQLREVQGLQESLTADRDSWEKRGREMETVLRKVKEEIVLGRREREELEFKLDEAEKRREAAEMMAQDAESKMAGMRAGKASAEAAAAASDSSDKSSNANRSSLGAAGASNKEVEMAVERVARELHALYKSKHETKVAALKKSYENRWDKKVRELQAQVDELSLENDEMRMGRDATLTRVDPARITELEDERKADKARSAAQIREREAEVDKLEAVVKTIQADNAELRVLLEQERVEKGELVQLAEEMMNMQQSFVAPTPPPPAPAPPTPAPTESNSSTNNINSSTGNGVNRRNSMLASGGSRTPARSSFSNAPPSVRNTPLTARSTHHQSENISLGSIHNGTGSNNLFRGSISGRPAGGASGASSGLRAPGTTGVKVESKIGRFSHHERARSNVAQNASNGAGAGAGARPGSGLAMRSGIMNSIERMGSYRGPRGGAGGGGGGGGD